MYCINCLQKYEWPETIIRYIYETLRSPDIVTTKKAVYPNVNMCTENPQIIGKNMRNREWKYWREKEREEEYWQRPTVLNLLLPVLIPSYVFISYRDFVCPSPPPSPPPPLFPSHLTEWCTDTTSWIIWVAPSLPPTPTANQTPSHRLSIYGKSITTSYRGHLFSPSFEDIFLVRIWWSRLVVEKIFKCLN